METMAQAQAVTGSGRFPRKKPPLEDLFETYCWVSLERCRTEVRDEQGKYWSMDWWRKLSSRGGGLQGARTALTVAEPQEGLLRLARAGRLDLSIEGMVLLPVFRPLFTQQEIATAEQHLTAARALVEAEGQ